MRRAAALVALPLLAAVAVAGCSSASSSAKPSSSTATSNSVVTATGSFGAAPKVTIPAEKAAPALYTKTVIQGSGSKLTSAETLEGNFVLYDWSGTTHKLLGSTYGSGGPTLFAGQMIPGLETALIGQPLGRLPSAMSKASVGVCMRTEACARPSYVTCSYTSSE